MFFKFPALFNQWIYMICPVDHGFLKDINSYILLTNEMYIFTLKKCQRHFKILIISDFSRSRKHNFKIHFFIYLGFRNPCKSWLLKKKEVVEGTSNLTQSHAWCWQISHTNIQTFMTVQKTVTQFNNVKVFLKAYAVVQLLQNSENDIKLLSVWEKKSV